MKKWWIPITMIAIFALYMIFSSSIATSPAELVKSYEDEWGIKLPVPDKVEELYSSGASFHGDGEWIHALSYEELDLEQTNLYECTDAIIGEVEGRVERFLSPIISREGESEAAAIAEKVSPETGDYYYRNSKNSDNDYLMALYKPAQRIVYIFEWNQ
ncbi:hypothetical protein DNH61_06035 [Paenibacillus sambharensis]|uniref:Uncharacterized protein n=1 Tax=Paenibacillus sambharensis TaxID=1803190 RepID=A0A2W1LQG6_9BACL|nr:hypothetical protein [Paenibacillus sambharensis]PZD96754.1 hypothetical protein DNH61_06035 [Paenibacillus sambharensis]